MSLYTKDPNAVLDYQWDWTTWLPTGDTIFSHTVSITDGDVVIDTDSHTDTTVTAWLSAGTDGTVAHVTARIVTVQGRTDDRTITLIIEHR